MSESSSVHPANSPDMELVKYDRDCREGLEKLIKNQNFWREVLAEGIEIPYGASRSTGNAYVNVAKYHNTADEDGSYPLDEEATIKEFARVVQWARREGYKVEKKYTDDEFKVILSETSIGRVEFYSTRQVVCKKVVTGVEIVPETTKEVYEYQCDKIAFLNVSV
jgi:hypothetical protein